LVHRKTDEFLPQERLIHELLREHWKAVADGRPVELLSMRTLRERLTASEGSVRQALKAIQGLYVSESLEASGPGRRSLGYQLDPSQGYVIAVKFGHADLVVRVADLSGSVRHKRDWNLPEEEDYDISLSTVTGFVRALFDQHEVPASDIAGVVASVAASARDGREVAAGSGMPGWDGRRPAEDLADRLGLDCPVALVNHANLAALGEHWWGVTRDAATSVYVTWGEGLGGGLVIAGHPHVGATGSAAELGHQALPAPPVIHNPDDNFPVRARALLTEDVSAQATCGRCKRSDCLEMHTSIAAMCRIAGATQLDQLVLRAHHGNSTATEAITAAAYYVGVALAPLVMAIDPDTVVIGGAFGPSEEEIVRPAIERGITDARVVPYAPLPRAKMAGLTDGGIAGAVAFGLDRFALDYLTARLGSRARRASTAPATV
jgi:predicted NBD/HSP70 family sugar kinase